MTERDIEKIEGYRQYGPDWDSYGARPFTPETIDYAKQLASVFHDLPAELNPAPAADGSVCFEICWPDGRELWIDVGPGEQMTAYIPKERRLALGEHGGCVCPSGAEATCMGIMCPRRGFTEARSCASDLPNPA